MVKDAINTFVNGDEDLAPDVCRRNGEIDALDSQISVSC